MSSRILNIEKLEKKFASLTRSRDSIQNLSLWIIKHKEFYKEIVNQWLDALKRDFNALTMFYVANDVIQNCGRKKAPEFRDAFATVLENAVSLEKVKEIKNEVTRMLTLWHDRAIYDDTFFKKLEDKLNSVTSSEDDTEMEISEAEVIATFKLDNLVTSLKKLKTLENELNEKESFLEDIEEPVLSNIDNIIVKMESQKELRKCDKYQKLVEDYISMMDRVIVAKKSALLNLKYSSIFYNAQHEDAKKVAHAYRIYGKKVKLLEKSLLEKLPSLPHQSPVSIVISPESPDFDCNSSQNSHNISVSPTENEKNNKDSYQENVPDVCISPSKPECDVTENKPKEILECTAENKSKEILECTAENKSEIVECTAEKVTAILSPDTLLNSSNEAKMLNSSNEAKMLNSSNEAKMLNSSNEAKMLNSSNEAKMLSSSNEAKTLELEESGNKTPHSCVENLTDKILSTEVAESSSAVDMVDNILPENETDAKFKQKISNDDDDCVDFLLEKAYDDQIKSKSNFKRKIDNLLKLQQSKICKLGSEKENKSSEATSESASISSITDSEIQSVQNEQNQPEVNKTNTFATSVLAQEVVVDKELKNSDCVDSKVLKSEDKSEDEKDEVIKCDQSDKSIDNVEISNTEENSESKNNPGSNSFIFQSLPDIPTELLKTILDKHRVNMNLSSSADMNTLNTETLCPVPEKPDQNDLSCSNTIKSVCITNDSEISVTEPMQLESSESGKSVEEKSQEMLIESGTVLKNKEALSSSHFLNTLQDILGYFTNKNSYEELKCVDSFSHFPSVPLENTLKIYNCLMQNNNKISSCKGFSNTSSFKEDTISSTPVNKFESNKIISTNLEPKMNLNLSETISLVDKNATVLHSNNIKNEVLETYSFNSKEDNLEIMDMEVDSDDESAK